MGVVFKRPVSVAQKQAAAAQHHQEFQEQVDQGFDYLLTDLMVETTETKSNLDAVLLDVFNRLTELENNQVIQPAFKSKKK